MLMLADQTARREAPAALFTVAAPASFPMTPDAPTRRLTTVLGTTLLALLAAGIILSLWLKPR